MPRNKTSEVKEAEILLSPEEAFEQKEDDEYKKRERKERKKHAAIVGGRVFMSFYVLANLFLHPIGYFYFMLPHLTEWELVPYFYILSGISVGCYFIAAFSDPGFLPTNTIKPVDYNTPNIKICHTCKLVRPIRAKHCPICNRCVAKFDHHCPFMNNCVGSKTDPYFFSFLWCQNLMLSIALYKGIPVYLNMDPTLVLWGYPKVTVCLVVISILILFWVVTFSLGLFGGFRVLFNVTTNECINAEKYSYISLSKIYHNRNDRGVKENLYRFFFCDDTPGSPPNPAEESKQKKVKQEFFDLLIAEVQASKDKPV